MKGASRSRRFALVLGFVITVITGCTSFGASEPIVASDAAVAAEPAPEGGPEGAATKADAGRCPEGLVLLGRFTSLEGKVNVHTPASTELAEEPLFERNGWYADPNCTAGADQNDLTYCQRLWSGSTLRLGPLTADSVTKPFFSRRCAAETPTTGGDEFICCGKSN